MSAPHPASVTWALALIVVLAVPPTSGEAQPVGLASVPEPRLDGVEAGVREQLQEARGEVARLEAQSPGSVKLGLALGELTQLYLAYDLLEPAAGAAAAARTLVPRDFRWAYYAGFADAGRGQLGKAEVAYREALWLRPQYQPTRIRLAEVLLASNQLGAAEELYRQVLEAEPDHAAAHYGLARVAAQQGDASGAVLHLEAALSAQPEADSLHYPLAQALRKLGRVEEARHHLEIRGQASVTMVDPLLREVQSLAEGAGLHFRRGTRALRAGRLAEAEKEYRQAVAADPESPRVRRALGLTLRRRGRSEEAVAEYKAAVRLEPENPTAHLDLGLALAAAEGHEEAVESFEWALDLAPDLASAHHGLGVSLVRLGRTEESLGHLSRALDLEPANSVARYQRAEVLLRLSRLPEARDELLKVVADDPGHVAARLNLGMLFTAEGKPEEALEQLDAVLALPRAQERPRALVQAHRQIARIRRLQGQEEEASRHLRLAAELESTVSPP